MECAEILKGHFGLPSKAWGAAFSNISTQVNLEPTTNACVIRNSNIWQLFISQYKYSLLVRELTAASRSDCVNSELQISTAFGLVMI